MGTNDCVWAIELGNERVYRLISPTLAKGQPRQHISRAARPTHAGLSDKCPNNNSIAAQKRKMHENVRILRGARVRNTRIRYWTTRGKARALIGRCIPDALF